MESVFRITLQNKYGLHIRPSTMVAQLANKFAAQITFSVDEGEPVDASNVMLLMTLGAVGGKEITVRAVGDDAEAAAEAMRELIAGRFGGID